MKTMCRFLILTLAVAVFPLGCNKREATTASHPANSTTPTFTLAWNEYPSSSMFGVAEDLGLLDGHAGKQGTLEQKHNVDVIMHQVDYETLLTMYGSKSADAVIAVQFDLLNPSLGRPGDVIVPVSTSDGADACVAVGIDGLDGLRNKTVRGQENSVSQYLFERYLTLNGRNLAEYHFSQMDPTAISTLGQSGVQAMVTWNPYVMQAVQTNSNVKVLFDSSAIPNEIVDVLFMARDASAREGGPAFARCVIEAYYEVNRRLNGIDSTAQERDEARKLLAARYGNLPVAQMAKVLTQTHCYATRSESLGLVESNDFQSQTMPRVVQFCVEHKMIPGSAKVGFDDPSAPFNFSTKYLRPSPSATTSE